MYLKICLNILQVSLSIPMRLGDNFNLKHLVRVKKKIYIIFIFNTNKPYSDNDLHAECNIKK